HHHNLLVLRDTHDCDDVGARETKQRSFHEKSKDVHISCPCKAGRNPGNERICVLSEIFPVKKMA
ncbi:hypothetical protein ACC695_39140, partial [Rhizobium ruizarguesonis]